MKDNVGKLFNHMLKYYCGRTDSLMPEFNSTDDVNQMLMRQIKSADVEAF